MVVFEFLNDGGIWVVCDRSNDSNLSFINFRLIQLNKLYKKRVRVRYKDGRLIDLID